MFPCQRLVSHFSGLLPEHRCVNLTLVIGLSQPLATVKPVSEVVQFALPTLCNSCCLAYEPALSAPAHDISDTAPGHWVTNDKRIEQVSTVTCGAQPFEIPIGKLGFFVSLGCCRRTLAQYCETGHDPFAQRFTNVSFQQVLHNLNADTTPLINKHTNKLTTLCWSDGRERDETRHPYLQLRTNLQLVTVSTDTFEEFQTYNISVEVFALLECYAAYMDSYRRFGTNYRSHLQGSSSTAFEVGTNRQHRNVCKYLCTFRNIPAEREFHLHPSGCLNSPTVFRLLLLKNLPRYEC